MAGGNGNGGNGVAKVERAAESVLFRFLSRFVCVFVVPIFLLVMGFALNKSWEFFSAIAKSTSETATSVKEIKREQKTIGRRLGRLERVFFTGAPPPLLGEDHDREGR